MANNPSRIKYPNALDSNNIDTLTDNVSQIRAGDFNSLRKAVLNVESELGIKPRGIYSTVRARLDALEAITGFGADFITSRMIIEADGTTAQDTNSGTGVKTGHIQDSAITTAKLADSAVTSAKLADNITVATLTTTGNTTIGGTATIGPGISTIAGTLVVTGNVAGNFGAFTGGLITGAAGNHAITYDAGDNDFFFTDLAGNFDSGLVAQSGKFSSGLLFGLGGDFGVNDINILQSQEDVVSFMNTGMDGYVDIRARNIAAGSFVTGDIGAFTTGVVIGAASDHIIAYDAGDSFFGFINVFGDYDAGVVARGFGATYNMQFGLNGEFEVNDLDFLQSNIDVMSIMTRNGSGVIDGYANLAVRNIQHPIETSTGFSGTYVIDLDGEAVRSVSLAGPTYFTATNLNSDMSKNASVRLLAAKANVLNSTLSFDSDWTWLGSSPTSLLDGYGINGDGYGGLLSVMSFGGDDTDIVAAFEYLGLG